MKFNELYNLILQSIITQDIQSKIKKAIQTLIKSGQLQNENDPRAQQVKTIIKRNNSIDINGKTKLDQLLKANQTLIKRDEAKKDNYLDSIPEFSQKKEYDHGVVIYKVQESKAGMNAVRKIVDLQWGKDANPWCLITPPMEQAWDFWCQYSEYPKHIAFQNGKLLAFSANDDRLTRWWDRNDRSSAKLKLEDGTTISVRYKWSKEQQLQKFIVRNGLTFNQKTGCYDSDKSVYLRNPDVKNGRFPVKFGVIKGNFNCVNSCYEIQSLQGAPKTVHGQLNIAHNTIRSLKGLEKTTVYGDFNCNSTTIENLNYSPKVKGQFSASRCKNLTSLQGAPQKVKAFYCVCNDKLLTLKGAPREVKGNFSCSECYGLTSLLGGPEWVGGDYDCSDTGITTLQGAAAEVGEDFICTCTEITNLQGAPDYVGHDLICSNTDSLTSLDGAPIYIGRNLVAEWCQNLRLVTGVQNSEIKGHINTCGCSNVSISRRLSIRYKLVDDPQQYYNQDNNYQDPDEEQQEEEWDPQWENEENEEEDDE